MLLSQNSESEEELDLIKGEWRAYLKWGFAASPLNQGVFDSVKTSDSQSVEEDEAAESGP